MALSTDQNAKMKTSRLYELCSKLFGKEFNGMFTAKRELFRDWVNEKTRCNEDHIVDLHKALDTWLVELEKLQKAQ